MTFVQFAHLYHCMTSSIVCIACFATFTVILLGPNAQCVPATVAVTVAVQPHSVYCSQLYAYAVVGAPICGSRSLVCQNLVLPATQQGCAKTSQLKNKAGNLRVLKW